MDDDRLQAELVELQAAFEKLLAGNLKAARLESGLTQAQTASQLGVSDQTVGRLENPRKVSGITAWRLAYLSSVYGCDVSRFFNGLDAVFPPAASESAQDAMNRSLPESDAEVRSEMAAVLQSLSSEELKILLPVFELIVSKKIQSKI